MKKILDTKINSKAVFHKPSVSLAIPLVFSETVAQIKIIFTKDLAKVTKFIPKLHSLIVFVCHTHRFDSKKQQILFLSSAENSI